MMIKATLKNRLLQKMRLTVTRSKRLPKADLASSLLNIANRGFDPYGIIDIGANKARWSMVAKAVFPKAKIVMIEPQLELEPQLSAFCAKNDNCQYVIAGAGDKLGELAFTLNPDTVSSSFTLTADEAKHYGFQQRMVPVLTVDHIVEKYFPERLPDILKIDAEGFEKQVLDGSNKLIGHCEIIFLEAHLLAEDGSPSGLIELVARMSDFGYAPYDFTWFGKRPCDGAVTLTEIVFAKKNGILRSEKGWH